MGPGVALQQTGHQLVRIEPAREIFTGGGPQPVRARDPAGPGHEGGDARDQPREARAEQPVAAEQPRPADPPHPHLADRRPPELLPAGVEAAQPGRGARGAPH
ncbi:MAG: hypothetical protein ACK559_36845, partial [bacterium]